MVENGLGNEQVGYTAIDHAQSCCQGSGISRDPSFSCWCDEERSAHIDNELENSEGGKGEDSDFELPFFQQSDLQSRHLEKERSDQTKLQQKSVHLNGLGTMDDASTDVDESKTGKHVSFDIENRSAREKNVDMNNDERLPQNLKSPISAADVLKTLFFILVWYTFSLFLTLYNKSLLGDDLGKFPAPLLMNTVHFTMQAVLSRFITWFWSHKFQPSVVMSWRDYFMRVVPTALGTAMDVNLSNASLVSISVTFATMCKSAAPIFLLLFAFAFRLESPSVKLSGIILIISFGILLTVAKETEFDFWGFVFVMLAAVMSGFRWCMTQILLQKEVYGLKNPLVLMSSVTPVMAVVTAILSLVLDPWEKFSKNNYFNNPWHITRSCLLMLFGGTLAFCMVLTEFILISVTSAVTVTIAGVVKEAVTILVAVFYFHDEFTWLKGIGLLIIIIGVSLFNWYKYEKLKGHAPENNVTDVAAKYVILEDEQDDSS